METLNLTPEEEARMMKSFEQSHRKDELVETALDSTGIEGKPRDALRWLLKGFILEPDDALSGEGVAPEWTQEYVTALAQRIAQDPLLMLVLTAWDLETRLRDSHSDTDGPVGIAVAPVVSMLSKFGR